MADNTQESKVVVTADTNPAQRAMDALKSKFAESAASMQESMANATRGISAQFGTITGVIETVQKRFVAIAAVVAGGKIFKDSIDETLKFSKENMLLARTLGITVTEASAWNIAMGDIYLSAEDVVSAVGKINRVIAEDEGKLNQLGIATRDSSGHLLSQGDILLNVTGYLGKFKEGTDRNVEGTRIFGKAWQEVAPTLKLAKEGLNEAAEKARSLGLAMTEESQGRVDAYRAAMNDVGDVLLGIKNAIAQAIMPVLTRLGQWFAEIGPGAVLVIHGAIGGLSTAFMALQNGIVIVWEVFKAFIFSVTDPLVQLGEAFGKLIEGDFTGAGKIMMDWPSRIGQRWSETFASITESSRRTATDIANLWGPGTDVKKKEGTGSGADRSNPKGDASRMERWQGELDNMKLAHEQLNREQGTFIEFSKRRELEFWQAKLTIHGLSEKERLALLQKTLGIEQALRKEAYEDELATLKLKMEQAKQSYAERERLALQYAERVKAAQGEDSKAYKDALTQLEQIKRDHVDKLRQIDDLRRQSESADRLAGIDEAQRQAEFETQLGLRTKEDLINIRRQAAAQRLEIELAEIAAEQAAWQQGTVEYEKLEAKKAEIRRKFKADTGGIDRDAANNKNQPAANILGSLENSFGKGIDAVLLRNRTAMQQLQQSWQQTGLVFMRELITRPLQEWAAGWARKLALNAGFLTTKNAQEATSAAVTTGTEASMGLASIGVSAARAAAGAYAAIAGIPYIGPVLAPITAAAALAAVMSFGKRIFSAEQGFDIPSGINPLVQAHQREMILPARYADVIRGMAEGRSGMSEGAFSPTLQIQALDARSFERFLSGPGGDKMLRELATRYRRFASVPGR